MPKKEAQLSIIWWFAKPDKDGFIHRSWWGEEYLRRIFDAHIIGICNTVRTDAGNGHFARFQHVKPGMGRRGGPFEFPVMRSARRACVRRDAFQKPRVDGREESIARIH